MQTASPKKPRMNPRQERRRLPVLIIPGFMSSGLVCESSTVRKDYEGDRVWLNLTSLGFESLHTGGALLANEEKRQRALFESKDPSDIDGYSEELQEEFEYQKRCKSAWLEHMALDEDMCNERPGIRLRALPGLSGVDYLTDNALTKLSSYVFGPCIRALLAMGYQEEIELDAAPYDWRLPPSMTEERDGYLTATMHRIERMYKENNQSPVVLLCHSMGCKMGHYLLNFARKQRGQIWIDQHIHTYMPVGAPHLGVSKALRASISGDKMTLDAFLNDEEGLFLGRSLGSGPWLMSTTLPNDVAAVENAILRKETFLEVTISTPIQCQTLFKDRRRSAEPSRLRLKVVYGDKELSSSLQPYSSGTVSFESELFRFTAVASLSHGLDKLQLFLQEPGIRPARDKEKKGCLSRTINCLLCPVKWILCCPCMVLIKTVQALTWGAKLSADALAASVGSCTPVATSPKLELRLSERSSYTKEYKVYLASQVDLDRGPYFRCVRQVQANVKVKWIPPSKLKAVDAINPTSEIAKPPIDTENRFAPILPVKHQKKPHIEYVAVSGNDLLRLEGMKSAFFRLVQERYDQDELRPRDATEAPPVRRIKAIYGINLPTEISAVYRLRPSRIVDTSKAESNLVSKYMLDQSAKMSTKPGTPAWQYEIKNGIVYETPQTYQKMTGLSTTEGKVVRCSGDGTVPYWSLQHVRTWHSPEREVHVEEIDRAEHRDILADPRFHQVLQDYLIIKK